MFNEIEKAFKGLYDIVVRLRAPDGCPWDREQTPSSLRGDLVEEVYECVEAIDEGDPAHVKEELGDIFLLAVMLSYMHEQAGLFSVSDVLAGVSEKLTRRHPHVFGNAEVKDSAEVLRNWARIKIEQEGRSPKDSLMDEVSNALPPLDRACKLQKKAAKAGFDWDKTEEVVAKVREEIAEVEAEIDKTDRSVLLEEELGDLFFAATNLCRFLKVEPSLALRRTNAKFVRRFKYIERRMREASQTMNHENLALMEKYWQEAKEKDNAENGIFVRESDGKCADEVV
ncbi:MAG: nucleoside triphosphate pyrophosphohydrolase [Treponema sp.]|jgi:tetrapyrrole methylase family protein/MazG family protein|nr:nucleoside triphosphate pyrophosphohydrolase [Treponema sp.]